MQQAPPPCCCIAEGHSQVPCLGLLVVVREAVQHCNALKDVWCIVLCRAVLALSDKSGPLMGMVCACCVPGTALFVCAPQHSECGELIDV